MPASRGTYDLEVLGPGKVKVMGSFRPQGSSALVSADTAPTTMTGSRAFSVARTSQGLYTVTFDDAWRDMESCIVSGRKADGNPLRVQGGDYDATAKTLQIRTFAGGVVGSGVIPLPLSQARELSGDATQVLASHGGILASDSTPVFDVVTAAKELGLTWAASNNDEIAWDVPLPLDFDESVAAEFHAMAEMGGATDTPVLTVESFFGVNGTDAGGSTGALADAVGEVSGALTAGNQAAPPNNLTVTLKPAAHTTDTVIVYSAWLEYASTKDAILADLADDVDNRISFECIFRNSSLGGAAAT